VKASFIDFEDSFSYNLIQELTELGLEVAVVKWMDWEALPEADLLVLGPGPGHPDDYGRIFPLVRAWLEGGKKIFGVCLGHQIFWRLQGAEVQRSRWPLHGQKIPLRLDAGWSQRLGLEGKRVEVQRYNSLAVMAEAGLARPEIENFCQDDEILISRWPGGLTYQFHPESQGTTFRRELLMPVLRELV
jgi:anthranilate/para-aminobenzoate synthase component II